MQVDDITFLDDVTGEGNIIVFHMRYIQDIDDPAKVSAEMKELLHSSGCESPDYKDVLKAGLSIKILYRDEHGGALDPLVITPADCPQK